MLSRRTMLKGGLASGLALTGAVAVPASLASAAAPRRPLSYPFTLGVASGDPLPDGVVIWTRLAPEPLAEDGKGGMPSRTVDLQWQVAEDAQFRSVVQRGTVAAWSGSAHAVHVEVPGLRPGRDYFYRFRTGGHLSPVGRTRTAPALRSTPAALAMAFASCSHFEQGWFTAYRRLAEDQPDLVLHLGDYQYEYATGTGQPRSHAGPETVTLAGYRQRHAQYKNDVDLQAAHAVAPWLVVFDDHEVDNNWAAGIAEHEEDQATFLARRANAFQAYYENMPLRRTSVPQGPGIQLFRRIQWGRLATFHMMDTRQFRDDQACGDGTRVDCAERLEPTRSITGDQQEKWLLDGLAASGATWDVLGQQVFFSQRDSSAGPLQALSMDGWDGYAASRQRIVDGFAAGQVRNPVVLTGDVHRHYASNILADFNDPGSAVVGTELVTTSITSGGDGSDVTAATDVQLAENPHIRFANSQRGYVRTRLTSDQLRADFRVLPYVTQRGAAAATRASFVIHDGQPGLTPAAAV